MGRSTGNCVRPELICTASGAVDRARVDMLSGRVVAEDVRGRVLQWSRTREQGNKDVEEHMIPVKLAHLALPSTLGGGDRHHKRCR
jgi:hypothetical protein